MSAESSRLDVPRKLVLFLVALTALAGFALPAAGTTHDAGSVCLVLAGQQGQSTSTFVHEGGKEWKETSKDDYFSFKEVDRDGTSVYLYDTSRDLSIQIDLKAFKVFVTQPGEPRRVLYDVLDALPFSGLTLQSAVYGQGDRKLGEYYQAGGKTWKEESKDGVFEFRETERTSWTVTLYDASRDVSIRIDLYTHKILYKSGSSSWSELYDILDASS